MLDELRRRCASSTTPSRTTSRTGAPRSSSIGVPHAAGLASEGNDPLLPGDACPTRPPDFSNPVALFNNIFWNNNAFTLTSSARARRSSTRASSTSRSHGTTNNADTFTPRFSDLTNGQILGPERGAARTCRAARATSIGADPTFVTPFTLELTVRARGSTRSGGGDDHRRRPAGRADRRLPHRRRLTGDRPRRPLLAPLAGHRPRRTLQQHAVRAASAGGRTPAHVLGRDRSRRTATTTASTGRSFVTLRGSNTVGSRRGRAARRAGAAAMTRTTRNPPAARGRT